MAYDFDVDDYLDWGDALDDNGVDFSASLWAHPDGATNTGWIISKWLSNSGWLLRRNASDASRWQLLVEGGTGGNNVSAAAGSVIADAWQHLVITFQPGGIGGSGESIGTVYRDNTQIAQATTMDPLTANTADFGVGNRAALDRDFDGRIAELAWWRGHLLTSAQRAMLARGFSADHIRPLPTFYRRLIRSLDHGIGTATATNTGSVAVIAHPRIIYLAASRIVIPKAAVVSSGGGYVYHHSRRRGR